MGATPSIQMFPPPPHTTTVPNALKQRSHSMAVDPFASSSSSAEAAAAEVARNIAMAANSNLRKRRKKDLLEVAIPCDDNGIQIQIIQASEE